MSGAEGPSSVGGTRHSRRWAPDRGSAEPQPAVLASTSGGERGEMDQIDDVDRAEVEHRIHVVTLFLDPEVEVRRLGAARMAGPREADDVALLHRRSLLR